MRTLILFLLPFLAAAETHRLTLKQAVDRALEQSPDLLIARYDEVRAQLMIREARDPFFPKLVLGSGLAYSSGFPLSIEGSSPSIVRADATQALFNRERSYEVAKVREQARGRGIDLQARRDEVALDVAYAWVEAARIDRALEVARQQLESRERLSAVTTARVAEGRELEVEAKKAAVSLAQARHRVASLNRDARIQQSTLALLLGFAATDQVEPVVVEETGWDLPADENAAIAQALEQNKALKSLESRMQAAGLDIKANEAARLPKINLVAQYGLFARFNNFDQYFNRFTRNNGQLGLSFQVPVLVGSAASARAAEAHSEAAKLRIEMARERNRVTLDTRRSYEDLRLAESLRDVSRLDLEAARDQVSVLLAQMDEGRAGLRQVEESRQVEHEKWIAYLDAQTRVEKARLLLLKQTGTLLARFR